MAEHRFRKAGVVSSNLTFGFDPILAAVRLIQFNPPSAAVAGMSASRRVCVDQK